MLICEAECHYNTFGAVMPGRTFSAGSYKYGFNGKEKDDEVKGAGNSYDFGARIYDPRIGRWLSTDPSADKFPSMSSYISFGNNPILNVDADGRVFITYIKVKNETTGKSEFQKVTFNGVNATVQTMQKGKAIGEITEYKSGTNSFVDNIITSYNYIVNNGADIDNAMQQVAQSPEEVQVLEEKNWEYTDHKIEYDFDYGLEVFDEENGDKSIGVQSPALGFWSEVYHAYIGLIDEKANKENNTQTKQEEYVHLVKEPQVIDKLKEKNPDNNEAKRKTYDMKGGDAWPEKTKNATSTEKSEDNK